MRARDLGRVGRSGGGASREPAPGAGAALAPLPGGMPGLPPPAVAPRLSVAALVYLRGRDADARLRELEARRVQVRPVLGALAARLRAIRGWRALGFRNLADFARERLGVEARTVSEWGRVWSALGELPRLREAVCAGEVPWTVARLLVGVATPETEAACLETVRGRTVRAVEALVAAWRAAESTGDVGATPTGPAATAGCGPAEPRFSEGAGSAGEAGRTPAESGWPAGAGAAAASATSPCAGAADAADAEDEERVAVRVSGPPELGARWADAVELARCMAGEELPVWAAAEPIAAEVASALPPEPGPPPFRAGAAALARAMGGAGPGMGRGASAAGVDRGASAAGGGGGASGAGGGRLGVARRSGGSRGPAGPGDPEPGLRHAAFPHVSWRPAGSRAAAEAVAGELEALARDVEDCGPHELERRLRAAVRLLQDVDLELGRILRQVLGRKLYRELGFESFERFVGERLDASPRTARRLVRLARAEHVAPAVAGAFRAGRLTAFQADVVLGALHRGTAPREEAPGPAFPPVAHAAASGPAPESSPVVAAALAPATSAVRPASAPARATASVLPARAAGVPEPDARWVALARQVTLRRLEAEAGAEPPAAVAFHAPPEVAAFFLETLERVRRGLGPGTSPGAALLAMLDHVIAAWLEQGARFRDYADFGRDRYRCTAPGCTARRELESHHIVFRSAGGPDEPGNRTTLCWFHHHAAVHAGRLRIAGRAPDRLFFELGARPDGPPLARYRSGDVVV